MASVCDCKGGWVSDRILLKSQCGILFVLQIRKTVGSLGIDDSIWCCLGDMVGKWRCCAGSAWSCFEDPQEEKPDC